MSTVKAVAVGGWADGRLVEFPYGSRQAYGCEEVRQPLQPIYEACSRADSVETFTIRRTLYNLEEIYFGDRDSREFLAVPTGWTCRQAIAHLLLEHRVVG